MKKAPRMRVRAVSGAFANRNPPSRANGTAPRENHPTTLQSSSRRLNHSRLPFPTSWATVRIGTASRIPKMDTRTGSRTAAPPNPVTAAKVAAIREISRSAKNCERSGTVFGHDESRFSDAALSSRLRRLFGPKDGIHDSPFGFEVLFGSWKDLFQESLLSRQEDARQAHLLRRKQNPKVAQRLLRITYRFAQTHDSLF